MIYDYSSGSISNVALLQLNQSKRVYKGDWDSHVWLRRLMSVVTIKSNIMQYRQPMRSRESCISLAVADNNNGASVSVFGAFLEPALT